ncbi:hypothetical protein BC628DRAFT_1411507 [Trametes gibbosa]|nr:hypothetical protein BC628DRAFT_1411507 [Trametes gibbosa]
MDTRPKKTVRFVNFHPRTPSPASVTRHNDYPSWSAINAAPPSPHSYPAFSAAPAEDAMVDPLLDVLPPPALPPLLWDISIHPDNIRLGSAHSPASTRLAHSDLARCAARTSVKNARLPVRKIVLIFPGIPLEVEVTPAADAYWSSRPLPYVTVGDLLYGLYKALRTSVAQAEYEHLDPDLRESLRISFHSRLNRDPQHHVQNLEHGVRRIDYLGERRRFLGIRPASGRELPPSRRSEEVYVVELGRGA